MNTFASVIFAAVLGAETIVADRFSTRRAVHLACQSEVCTISNQTWATCCVEGGLIGWPETVYSCMACKVVLIHWLITTAKMK
jgi:hypothetical protein